MKLTYILIICLGGIVILFALLIILQLPGQQKQQISFSPSPSPIPNVIPINKINTVATSATNNFATFATRIDNRPHLSIDDDRGKQNLIASLSANQEVVYANNEFTISYIRDYDMFQVEIDSPNIQQAEKDTVAWFQIKGISKKGVCDIPVQFYPSFDIRQQLQNQHTDVPPLALGC